MEYKETKFGNIVRKEGNDYIIVIMDEKNYEYGLYLEYLKSGGKVEKTDIVLPSDVNCDIIEIQLWRLRVILKIMNLEEQIIAAFELLEEPSKTAAKYIWQFGTTIDRYSDTVLFIQQVLQLKDNQVDEIFKSACDIKL